jgi:hypothetical protein
LILGNYLDNLLNYSHISYILLPFEH